MEVHEDCAEVWCVDCVEVRGDLLEGMEIV